MTPDPEPRSTDADDGIVGIRLRSGVAVSGADAVTFANGQLSQDLGALVPGTAGRSLLLEPDGHLGDLVFVLRCSDERVVITGAANRVEAIKSRLARFKLRVAATLEEIKVVEVFGDDPLVSQARNDAIISLGEGAGPPRRFSESAALLGAVASGGQNDQISDELLRRGVVEPEDATWCSLPHELGRRTLDASVSFTKGCYTGQELVARVDARSANPPFRLCTFRSDTVLDPSSPVVREGEEVGTVCRVAKSSGTPEGSSGFVRIARRVAVEELAHLTVEGNALSCHEV